jgi:pimeloyl-ACP methyl ester carboxylesterase
MIIAGLRAGYPELAGDDRHLSEAGRGALVEASTSCVGDTLDRFGSSDLAALFAGLPLTESHWQAAIAANRAGDRATDVPVFIYMGRDDAPVLAKELLKRYCALGVTATLRLYPKRGHMDVFEDAFDDIVAFITARMAGDAAPSDCP